MAQEPVELRKLADAELRRMAEDGASDAASVLVELEAPQPEVTLETRRPSEGARRAPRRIEFGEAAEAEVRRRAAQVEGALVKATGMHPHYLAAAHCFVADLTGPQLAEVAAHPFVRSIQANRRLVR